MHKIKTMITYEQIEKKYGCKIPKKFKVMLGDKINSDFAQSMIKKALAYKLTDDDYKILFAKGKQGTKEFGGLNYICTIFIHPITAVQSAYKAYEKLFNADYKKRYNRNLKSDYNKFINNNL